MIRFFYFGSSKMVFKLLTKIVIGHMFIIFIKSKKRILKKHLQELFIAANLVSIIAQIISYILSFE